MPITPLPEAPNKLTDTPRDFAEKADAWVAALDDFTTDANALEANVNSKEASAVAAAGDAADAADAAAASAASAVAAPGTSATSDTSIALGLGEKVLTIETGKDLVVGAKVVIARTLAPTTYMYGTVTAYDDQTGELTVESEFFTGSGSYSMWSVSLSGPGMGLNHPTVSAASNSDNSGATVIQDLFFDAYGHCTGRGTKTLSYSDVGAAASSHTHSYLPLAGGTMTGDINLGSRWLRYDGNSTTGRYGFSGTTPYIYITNNDKFILTANGVYADFSALGSIGRGLIIRQGGTEMGAFLTNENGNSTVYSSNDYGWVRLGTARHTIQLDSGLLGDGLPGFRPIQGGVLKLGGPSNKWHTVYAVNGSIDTSDETEKIISAIGDCSWLYELEPISFRWKNDPARCHLGFSAQRVFEAAPKKDTWLVHPPVPVTGEDGQAVTDEDGQPVMSKWGMSKTELIAPMLRLIQEQKKMIDKLEARVAALEGGAR